MNMQEVNELIQTFSRHGLTCLELEENGKKIVIKKEYAGSGTADVRADEMGCSEECLQPQNAPSKKAQQPQEGTDAESLETGHIVRASLVGMFYSSPSPEEEPFVRVGDTVKKGQVIGIIEAMKLMNEVTCDADGTVKEIFAENGQVVEYGQPLFSIG